MYIPPYYQETDSAVLRSFISQYSFALLSIAAGERIEAVHLPLLWRPLDAAGQAPEHGVLVGHVARANPIWRAMDGGREALAVFSGPHAYVSPRWYVTRPQVPTWNYTTVHAYGVPRVVEDPHWAMQLLRETVDKYESALVADAGSGQTVHQAWSIDSEPEYTQRLLGGIVAFELPIRELQGKFKLNQNKSAEDRQGVMDGLESTRRASAIEIAELLRERL